ncbi:hypothetical protein M1446_00725 [Candidatus Dependentiae bacterium]|nr:hypothetical protein [Candidatus Dependentiae bacterium]
MQSQMWILNSSLLTTFLATLVFIFFSQVQIPKRARIEPEIITKQIKKEAAKVDCTRIVTDDLFGTYVKPVVVEEEVKTLVPPIPVPPTPKFVPEEKEIPKPQFLEPLALKLKGIIMGTNESMAQAIVQNTKTNEEKLYSQNDKIEDAYILRILPQKIILIRSNGQQESLFINQTDAQAEINTLASSSWSNVIQSISSTEFIVDPNAFAERINNLAQFIDALDLTTVFRKGKSLGVRVGRLTNQSIGSALGLQAGDIIVTINGMRINDTKSRVEVYNQVTKLSVGDKIVIEFARLGQRTSITYHLQLLKKSSDQKTETKEIVPTIEKNGVIKKMIDTEKEKEMLRNEQLTFKPLIRDITQHERQAMLNHGARPSQGRLFKNMQ